MENLLLYFGNDNPIENVIVLAMTFFSVFLVIVATILTYQIYKGIIARKKRAIRAEFIRQNNDAVSDAEKRKSELLKPRMRVANLGAPPNILFKNASNLGNSTDCQPSVASIDFLEKDQYAFILLCYWEKQ